jgi:DNA-binding MarR family transcriptional regulator
MIAVQLEFNGFRVSEGIRKSRAALRNEVAIDAVRTFTRLKYDEQLTDLQALILLDLSRVHLATLTDLSGALRFALNSVSAACMVLEGRGLVQKHWKERPYRKAPYSLVYLHLTDHGAVYVRKLAGQ